MARTSYGLPPTGGIALAELCRSLVMEAHAPAALLINRARECLYSLGPIDRYLRMAAGHTTHDILAMARPGVRAKLKSAIERAGVEAKRVVIGGVATGRDGHPLSFSISAQPVPDRRDGLLLVCFIDDAIGGRPSEAPDSVDNLPPIAQLKRELEITKTELSGAIRDLEVADEEHKAANEEALSVNEEFQSTNEELLTSKEELQSLNEELTALNGQLQETLERQRATSDDLQNVLFSTDIALLFLDADLKIRFFTPSIRSMFNVIVGDIGRPIGDLRSLSADDALSVDAQTVLQTLEAVEREIETAVDVRFIRRILPYRAHNGAVEGVIITFTEVTERSALSNAREAAHRLADTANAAKSRFLAAASHDLRQPLQTMSLLQGLLAKVVEGERAKLLVGRLEEALAAMSGMLNTMLDINQIEAGVVRAKAIDFPVKDLLSTLKDEFAYHAQAHKLDLRMVPCSAHIRSDPRLLEQMLRNLLSNALKFTKSGKVLIGCRRRGGVLSIQVWDTGIGVPAQDLTTIFDEYHQLGNAARERSLGLGLGLAIVQRLATLLGHKIGVRSAPGQGSVFSIEVSMGDIPALPAGADDRPIVDAPASSGNQTGAILVVEDDPEVRGLLDWVLRDAGHKPTTASDGSAAMTLVTDGMARPDLILADYNLPGGMNGVQVAARLREIYHHAIPVVILTGDISYDTLRDIAAQDCVQLNKPLKVTTLIETIHKWLPASRSLPAAVSATPAKATDEAAGALIYIVDDDSKIRAAIREVLEADGRTVLDFESCESFLSAYQPGREACLLIDAYLPGMTGLDLLRRLQADGHALPSIMITGNSDVPIAVEAMKAGARDFIEKPISAPDLIAGIDRALEQSRDSGKRVAWREDATAHLAGLTPRQREIMDMVLAGHPSKNIAADLGISQRTVENHRASIMKKTGAKSLPALARLALTADRS